MSKSLVRRTTLVSGALVAALAVCCASLALAGPTAKTKRANISSAGAEANNSGGGGVLSANGRYVAFYSEADNLVPNDNNGQQDVFVRDLVKRKTRRVSISTAGAEANELSSSPAISANGRFVAFGSIASNLTAEPDNHMFDVFVRDRKLRKTTMVSFNSAGVQGGNFGSSLPDISDDGNIVVFRSGANNLAPNDSNGVTDIFVRNMSKHKTQRASVSSAGVQGDLSSSSYFAPSVSGDGKLVAFESTATTLVTPDPDGNVMDVYLRNRSKHTTRRLSIAVGGGAPTSQSYHAALSANGRFVVFTTEASNLIVGGDTNGVAGDIIVRSLATGANHRVSEASNGAQGPAYSSGAAISANGRYVAFQTTNALVSGDTNSAFDIYVNDSVTHGTKRVSLTSTGNQVKKLGANNPAISNDGRFVTFQSEAAKFVPTDGNHEQDVFVRGPLF